MRFSGLSKLGTRLVAGAAFAVLATLGAACAQEAARAPALQSQSTSAFDDKAIIVIRDAAGRLDGLRALVVAHNGKVVIRQGFEGHAPDELVNIKSLSKTFLSALVGIAIDKGLLTGADQPVAPLLAESLPPKADPRLHDITLEDLLSMQAGLRATSGPNYGRWIASPNWVKAVLAQPFEAAPGGSMIYSTGNTHLLSAILTKVSGASTAELAQQWLGTPLGFRVPPWERDPQGIFLGGNNMALRADDLLRLGELYRNGGVHEGRRLLSADWITASWQPRGTSRYTHDRYGLGWFIAEMAGHHVYYGWGYGGQMLYVVPDLGLTVVIISDPNQPSGGNGYVAALHALLAEKIMPAAVPPTDGSAAVVQ